MGLEKVSISIKTFLRDPYLFNTVREIERTLPECNMIITDDGEMSPEKQNLYNRLKEKGHTVVVLFFDSGFGRKSNAAAEALRTPYLLIASDDFDFSPASVREGIERLLDVLESNENVGVASGRVNNIEYEFFLKENSGVFQEVPLSVGQEKPFHFCDLTVNYNLIRKKVFEKVWWEEVKIGGGEHAAFYIDCKRAGIPVVYVPDVNINEQRGFKSQRYREFRNRALSPERPCFVKRGIKKYILGNGEVDYVAPDFR